MIKKITTFTLGLAFLLISSLKAQDITGDWNGVLDVMGTQLTLVFHIQETDSGYTATFDSPDPGAMGIPFTTVDYADGSLTLRVADIGAFINQQVEGSLRPWSQFFFHHDPADELRKITIPVLSLIGSQDVQAPPVMNHPPIRQALEEAGNKDFTIKELPGLNHMFQESETGNMSEYAEIEQTFSPTALDEVTRWVKDQVEK